MKIKLTTVDNKEFILSADSTQSLLNEIEQKVKQYADHKEAFNITISGAVIHSDSLTIFNTDTDREELAVNLLKVEAVA